MNNDYLPFRYEVLKEEGNGFRARWKFAQEKYLKGLFEQGYKVVSVWADGDCVEGLMTKEEKRITYDQLAAHLEGLRGYGLSTIIIDAVLKAHSEMNKESDILKPKD